MNRIGVHDDPLQVYRVTARFYPDPEAADAAWLSIDCEDGDGWRRLLDWRVGADDTRYDCANLVWALFQAVPAYDSRLLSLVQAEFDPKDLWDLFMMMVGEPTF